MDAVTRPLDQKEYSSEKIDLRVWRRLQQRARNGHALLLPARKRPPALAHHGGIAVLEAFNHIVHAGRARGGGDVVHGGAGPRNGNVFANGAAV